MSILIEKDLLKKELQKAFSLLSDVPVLLHTDLLKIGITQLPPDRQTIGADYEEALRAALDQRPLIIPSFNYDFCRTGQYDRQQDLSKVGTLSEYFRQKYADFRTYTPVFNFVVNEKPVRPVSISENVFGSQSLFAELYANKGIVAFLGAEFASNTFLHYVEECHAIGYRYLKTFKGSVIDEALSIPAQIDYRVRPLGVSNVIYDWPRLIKELKERKILKETTIGHGTLFYYQTYELFQFWSHQMQKEELYLLTPESQQITRELYRLKGYPLQLDMFEKR